MRMKFEYSKTQVKSLRLHLEHINGLVVAQWVCFEWTQIRANEPEASAREPCTISFADASGSLKTHKLSHYQWFLSDLFQPSPPSPLPILGEGCPKRSNGRGEG